MLRLFSFISKGKKQKDAVENNGKKVSRVKIKEKTEEHSIRIEQGEIRSISSSSEDLKEEDSCVFLPSEDNYQHSMNMNKAYEKLVPEKKATDHESNSEVQNNYQCESNNNIDNLNIPANKKESFKSGNGLIERIKRDWLNLSPFGKIGIVLGVLGVIISLLTWAIDRFIPLDPDNSVVDEPQVLLVSIDDYIKTLEEKSGGKVLGYDYADFDGDSMMEMFAVIANVYREDSKYGTFWYVNSDKVVELIDEEVVYPKFYSIELEKKAFLATTVSYGDTVGSQFTYLWTVSNGIPQEYSFSPAGQQKILYFNVNKYNEIEIHVDYYDDFHEYVTYYLYFDGKDFHEYGGIQISLEDLGKVPGIDGVIDTIATMKNGGATVSDIFYRENGIIDINYVRDEIFYDYLRIRLLDNNMIEYPDHGDDRGYISSAYYDRIATYPDSFPY